MSKDIPFTRLATAGLALALVAFGGWGAFAFSLAAASINERGLRAQIERAAVERQTLADELKQVRAAYERSRHDLEASRRDGTAPQQEYTSLREQKAREDAAGQQPRASAPPAAKPQQGKSR